MHEQHGDESGSQAAEGDTSKANNGAGNIAGPIYMAALVLVALGLNYCLIFIWPSEDKSLTYLPRFLSSIVLAFLLLHLLGLRQKS